MAVKITARYLGEKKVELTHLDSGAQIVTTAPRDNNGDGNGFSPTDLVAAALGSCILTIMAIFGERTGIDMSGAHAEVEKHMNAAPRRIGRLPVIIHLPSRLGEKERRELEVAGRACPVHKSLDPDVESVIEFVYDV